MVFVVIRHKTKPTAGRALAFIVRIFVNDTIAIAVWTSFHATAVWRSSHVCLCTVWLRERTFLLSHYSRLDSAQRSMVGGSGGFAVRASTQTHQQENGAKRLVLRPLRFLRVTCLRGSLEALRGKPGINLLANLVLL